MSEDGESSRCFGRRGRAQSSHDASLFVAPGDRHAQSQGGHHGGISQLRALIRSRWESSPTRRARSRSSGSPTPTSPDGHRRHQRQGRPARAGTLELYLEDGATDDAVAAAKAAKLVEQDHVDVIFGGIYSSTRQAIKGPAVVEGKTLYIYPEQYEGQESDPLIFCTGPGAGAAGRPVHPVADAGDRGEDVLPAVRRLHLAARAERARPGGRDGQRRRRSSARSTSRSTTWTTRATVERINVERRRRGVQHDRAARGRAVLRAAVRVRLHAAAAGSSSARTSTRTS